MYNMLVSYNNIIQKRKILSRGDGVDNFNERLIELRTEKGISQKTAAIDLGVSQALLSHYEKGIREYSLSFLCKAAEYYGVSADYILKRTNSRTGVVSEESNDVETDNIFNTATIYRAALMTGERMNAGSSDAGEVADLLYAVTTYRLLNAAAQKGYIPKRWFSIETKHAQALSMALAEYYLNGFPEKNVTARRYGGPEPKSIETTIKGIESILKKGALNSKIDLGDIK